MQAHDIVVELVRRLGCRAYSVGYRLSPEHPFPAALRDSYSVLSWLHLQEPSPLASSSSSSASSSGFILGGDSAGANLSLVLALLAQRGVDADLRDDSGAAGLYDRICHLALLYPSLYEPQPQSLQMRYLMPRGIVDFFEAAYLGEDEQRRAELKRDFRVAPLRSPSLLGMPPVTVLSAEYDALRESNLLLVKKLREAGVDVTHVDVAAAPHGFLTFPKFAADAAKCKQALGEVQGSILKSISSLSHT